MPKRKSSSGRFSFYAERMKLNRINETPNEHHVRLESLRNNAKKLRLNETGANREVRLEFLRNNSQRSRLTETVSNREVRITEDRNRAITRRQTHWADLNSAAFHYDSQIHYK